MKWYADERGSTRIRTETAGGWLLELAAAFHAPGVDDFAVADGVDVLVEVHGDADVVGEDVDPVAYRELGLCVVEIDVAVLLVHFMEAGVGGFADFAESNFGGAGEAV